MDHHGETAAVPIPLVAIRDGSLSLEWCDILHDSCSIPFSTPCGIINLSQAPEIFSLKDSFIFFLPSEERFFAASLDKSKSNGLDLISATSHSTRKASIESAHCRGAAQRK